MFVLAPVPEDSPEEQEEADQDEAGGAMDTRTGCFWDWREATLESRRSRCFSEDCIFNMTALPLPPGLISLTRDKAVEIFSTFSVIEKAKNFHQLDLVTRL